MELTLLKCKLHRGVVTESNLNYEGSITLDAGLMEAAGILPYEQVDVLNITNGQRFTTYAISGDAGSGQICVNGAAARLVQKGDRVIVCAFARMSEEEAQNFQPTIVLLNDHNQIVSHARVAA